MRTYLANALLKFRNLQGCEEIVWLDCLNFIYEENNALAVAVTDYKIILENLKIDHYINIYSEMPIDDEYIKLSAKASIFFQQYMVNNARLTGLKSLCLLLSTLEDLWRSRNDLNQIPWTDKIGTFIICLFDRLGINSRYKFIDTIGTLESASDHRKFGHPTLNIIRSLFSRRILLFDIIHACINKHDVTNSVTINLLGSLLCCHARCMLLTQFCYKNINIDEERFLCALGMICARGGQFNILNEHLGQFAMYTNSAKKQNFPSNVEDIVRTCKKLVDAVEAIPTVLDSDGLSLRTDIFPCIVDSAARLREVSLTAQ